MLIFLDVFSSSQHVLKVLLEKQKKQFLDCIDDHVFTAAILRK